MTRNERRKAARKRKDAKASILMARALRILKEETAKRSLSDPRLPKRSPKGLGNRGIYQAIGMFPAPGFTSGCFKDKPQSERTLRDLRATER